MTQPTDLIFVNATSNPALIQIDLVTAPSRYFFSSTLSAGATTNHLVPESTEFSITTYNADTDQLIWQSGDFGVAAGLRPIIVLVDHFGPGPGTALYVTPIDYFRSPMNHCRAHSASCTILIEQASTFIRAR